jgi:D-3-phosphoglycerate dehydrogenase
MGKNYRVVALNVPHPSFEIERNLLQDIADVDTYWCDSADDIIRVASDADGMMIADIPVPLTSRILRRLKKVKVISVYGVGTDLVDVKAATEQKIVVTNAPDYGITEVADHTMALMLSLVRKEKIRKNVTQIREMIGEIHRLSTMNLGLIGFGRIARAVAERAKAFGLRIVAYDPYVPESSFKSKRVERVDLSVLLEEADVISIHTLLTDETWHLITEREISRMKKGVYLVNTSRGAIVEEKALLEAICSGHIAGAALDVFEREPLEKDSPLFQMENVILTPHVGWYSEEAMADQKKTVAVNTRKVLTGETPPHRVNA